MPWWASELIRRRSTKARRRLPPASASSGAADEGGGGGDGADRGMKGAERVAIVGAALSDCGRVDDKTAFHLHQQATSRALADAGIDKRDVDGFMSCGMGSLAPIEVAEYLGMGPMTWVDGTSVGGSSWE